MKKYSTDYFEKKYKILFDKLLQKEDFVDDIKATRKELGLPTNGFANGPELADFFISKMNKSEKKKLTMWAFLSAYEYEQKRRLTEDDRDAFTKAFMKKHKNDDGIGMLPMMIELGQAIDTHHNTFTKYPLFEGNKYLSKLYKTTFKLMQKYWGVDLLDDHIIFHYIEKYLFMGQAGVNEYKKTRDFGLYRTYWGMVRRCKYKSQVSYKYYIEKGIIVEWKSYIDFKNDMYESFLNHIKKYGKRETTIDRIDSNKNYCKENCRWATYKEQYKKNKLSK